MKKHFNIEFLRFGFSLIIVYFHILHSNIIPFTGGHGTYLDLQYWCRMAEILVNAFLIIAGYFLYTSWARSPEKPFIEFALHRYFRVWPVFAFYMVCFTFMNGDVSEHTLLDLALLRCTGLSLTHTEIIWYVAPFFWCSLLMYAVLKLCRKGTAALIFALLAYWGYLINLNYTNGSIGKEVFGNILGLAMLHVAGGLSIGILIAMAMDALAAEYRLDISPRSRLHTILFSLIEAASGILLFLIVMVRRPFIHNIFSVVVIFSVLFVCFINRLGIFSRLLDRPVFARLGKYAYSIYVMQQVSFDIMEKTFWQNSAFLRDHELPTLLISVSFSVLVGITVYHLVEHPVYSAFRKWENIHRDASHITG